MKRYDEFEPEVRAQLFWDSGRLKYKCSGCQESFNIGGPAAIRTKLGKSPWETLTCGTCRVTKWLTSDMMNNQVAIIVIGSQKKIGNNYYFTKICVSCHKPTLAHANAIKMTLARGGVIEPRCSDCILNDGFISAEGYVTKRCVDPDHPRFGKQIAEHRLVMEEYLGRYLTEAETVHHINGNRRDNRVENLQLRQGAHGQGQVVVCLDCHSHRIGFEEL